jgi:hypothetical protein
MSNPTVQELQAELAAQAARKAEIEKQIAAQVLPVVSSIGERLGGEDLAALELEFAGFQNALPPGTMDAQQASYLASIIRDVRTYFTNRARDLSAMVTPPAPIPVPDIVAPSALPVPEGAA